MAQSAVSASLNLGFMTVLHEANGYTGGYLVVNLWGRPLEFRVSTAVQPNRIQQILYGETLQPYICADLIGKTLVDKTSAAAQIIFTDRKEMLDLRLRVEVPVVWLAAVDDGSAAALAASDTCIQSAHDGQGLVLCHPRRLDDVAAVRELFGRIDEGVHLTEPFARVREAMSEARKVASVSRG